MAWSHNDHGSLDGLGDDDHPNYLNETRHDADDHSGLSLAADDLSDVDTTTATPTLDQVLKWDGSNWVPGDDDTGSGSLPTGTTKGDLAVFDGTNWVRIGVGANNTVLTADSAQTEGIKWAASGSGGDHGSLTGLADDDHSFYPKGSLGYAQVTANQTIGGTTADLTGLSVTVTTVASRRIKITAHGFVSADSGERSIIRVQEGGTILGRASDFTSRGTGEVQAYQGSVVLTPTAASHTYKLVYQVVSGTNHTHVAGAGLPAFILVEDLGPI